MRNNNWTAYAYYPWGEERTLTTDGTFKFGTYLRDVSATQGVGEDYAMARHYNNNFGRFWSADPGGISTASPMNPTSLNRYAYGNGDPVNNSDPTGLVIAVPPDQPPPPPDGCSDCGVFGPGDPDPTPCPPSTQFRGPIAHGGGGGGGRGQLPQCNTTSGPNAALNAQAINWIKQYGGTAAQAAVLDNSDEAILLGLSSVESGWGTGDFVTGTYNNGVPINNFFSQHAPAPNENGTVTINGNYMATYANYEASAVGFAMSNSGMLIAGMTDPTTVATTLQNAGLYGINPNGTKDPNFVKNVVTNTNFIANRLICVP